MSKLQRTLTKRKSRYQDNSSKTDLLVGSLIATFVAITPYLFTLWQGVPDTKTWDTFFGIYTSNYYESVQILVWTLLGKFIPLILVILWMFTCRHWWYHALIVPIAMYLYQIIEIFNDDVRFAETNQILYLLPVMAIVIPSIYLIRARMFNTINDANKTMEELEEEFKIKPKSILQRLGDYF